MTELNFSLSDFRQDDLPNLLIDIWHYAYCIKETGCNVCQTYQDYCIVASREKWKDEFIDFDFAFDNLQKQNTNWVNFDNFSLATRNEIFIHLLKEKKQVF